MPSKALRYLVALAFTAAAAAVQTGFPRLFANVPFFLFWAAIFLSATFCGFGPALASTAVSAIAVAWVFLEPRGSILIEEPIGIAQTVLFLIIGTSMSWAITTQRRGEHRRERDAREQLAQIRAAEEERARLASDVARQRERLSSIISNIPGVVWEAWGEPDRKSQRIDFVSDHVSRMLGYTVEEWLATPNFWLTIVHPDDVEAAAKNAHEHYVRGGYGTNTFRWLTKEGRAIWAESHSTVVTGDDGQPAGMRGVTLDVTARKRAEEALRVLADTSEALASTLEYEQVMPGVARVAAKHFDGWCAISFIDEGEPRRVAVAHADPNKSDLAQKLLGIAPNRNLPKKVSANVDRRQPTILNDVDDAFIDSATSSAEHAAVTRQLGLGSMLVAPLVARDKLIGAISIMSAQKQRFDQSDAELAHLVARRVAVALDNAQLYRAAVEASNAKDEFLATVSHELRTPMTATLGWVRMLNLGHFDQETQKTALEAIERSTRAQAKLIEDILDVSSIILGKFRLDSVPVDLTQVLNAAIDTLRPALSAKSMTLDVDTSRWQGVVQGDPNRLQQVVWNLASNAIKFGRREGRIEVRLERAKEHARISVKDDGAGIDPEFLPHVFDRFRQGDSGATRSHGGLGLGLAIVRHLVELHGGTVYAASDGRGAGATFTVELPATIERADDHHRIETPLPGLSSRQILLVDDEHPTLELFSTLLRRCGALVRTAQSVDEALALFDHEPQDVVVTDIAMPNRDGIALLHEIRRREDGGRRMPIIALTALSELPTGDFDRTLRKPIDPVDLAFEVAKVVSSAPPPERVPRSV